MPEQRSHTVPMKWAQDPFAGRPCLIFGSSRVSFATSAAAVASMAQRLQDAGLGAGSVLGISLQNVPGFPIGMLAAWQVGAGVLLINPMYRDVELNHLLSDSSCTAVLCEAGDTARFEAVATAKDLDLQVLVLPQDWCPSEGAAALQTEEPSKETQEHIPTTLVRTGCRVERLVATADETDSIRETDSTRGTDTMLDKPDSTALLTYTSGTTGPPRAAIATHRQLLASTRAFIELTDLNKDDVVLTIAPLFHITGAVINAAVALASGCPLVLTGRFDPVTVLNLIDREKVTFTAGSITAYLALAELQTCQVDSMRSIRLLYSGGAPIPPATVERFETQTGHYIHNVYGMTETTSAVVAVPPGLRAPVDPMTGALSVGKAMSGVEVTVLDADGSHLPSGSSGELAVKGPSIVSGYLNAPEKTAETFVDGWLRTGDAAVIDPDGWVYLVDRIKDQINTSGYKVWPREVEDALTRHPSVAQAAVVGMPDEYRSEQVVAFVVLAKGKLASQAELQNFVRSQLAAYKVPRQVHIVDGLPTTATGKVQRRVLRSTE